MNGMHQWTMENGEKETRKHLSNTTHYIQTKIILKVAFLFMKKNSKGVPIDFLDFIKI